MNKSRIRIYIRHFSTYYNNFHKPNFWWDYYVYKNFKFLGFSKELQDKSIEERYYE